MELCRFQVAVDRMVKQGEEKKADFPRVVVFGKQAVNCDKYLAKGRLVGIQGRIQTGSYENKDGQKIYTTDVIADRVEFLEWGEKKEKASGEGIQESMSDDFATLDDDVPF